MLHAYQTEFLKMTGITLYSYYNTTTPFIFGFQVLLFNSEIYT